MTAPLPDPDEPHVEHWTSVDWAPWVKNRLVDERRIRYLDYGSGPTLVLLHGMASSWQWWLENIPTLGRRHRIIAVDLPGCGNSEQLPPPAEMSHYAHTVLGLLDHLGIRSATVAGHSMGGLVAIAMSQVAPQQVKKLILVDAGGAPMTERRLAATLVLLRMCAAVMQRGFVRRGLATSARLRRIALRGAFFDPDRLSPALAAQTMPLFAGPGFIDSVAAAGRAVRSTEPESIRCPVLLVWGERDMVAPVRGARDMDARLADSELVVLPNVGHSPMVESPDTFNELVLAFTAQP